MTSRLKTRLGFWTGAMFLAAGIAATAAPDPRGDEQPPESTAAPRTYIGEVGGAPESARIAVVVEGNSFVAYVCSADQAFNDTFSRWFRGDVTNGGISAKAKSGAELSATVKGEGIAGALKAGGKSYDFTAKLIAGDANAGLFRAGEAFGADDYVVGWIVDEKENIVGTGGKVGGKVQTLQPPKGNANLAAQIGGKKLDAAKVGGAAAAKPVPPVAPGRLVGARKLDAAGRAEILQDTIDQGKAEGGNPVQAMLIHQLKRFTAGKKPETKLEEKVFAILKTAPAGSIASYVKNWDGLPKASRDAILGPAAKQLDPNVGLDSAVAKKLTILSPRLRDRTQRAVAPAGTIKAVSVPLVKCVDETNPEFLGSDEIFAIHTVIVGNGEPVVKRTGLLTGFDDGVEKSFPPADAGVFPLPGQSPIDGAEVLIVTTLYEDDGSGVVAVLNFLKPLIQVAVVLAVEELNGDKKTLSEFEKAAIKLAVDGAIKAVSGPLSNLLVQPLGTDSIVARPDGTVVAENGGTKSKMTFKKVKNGDVRFEYELKGFVVAR